MDNFWLYEPCVLFTNFQIPKKTSSINDKLNFATQIIIIITFVLLLLDNSYWFVIPIVGLILVLLTKYMSTTKYTTNSTTKSTTQDTKERFTIPPTYIDGAEPMTTIPPINAEEWQIPPPIYDEYTNTVMEGPCGEYKEDRPVIGQYISSSKLFPYQNSELNNLPLADAQLFMNDEFTRDSLQFRNDMTRLFVNKLDRWYRHGCYDSISPFNSY